jgi:hypothetical protein
MPRHPEGPKAMTVSERKKRHRKRRSEQLREVRSAIEDAMVAPTTNRSREILKPALDVMKEIAR